MKWFIWTIISVAEHKTMYQALYDHWKWELNWKHYDWFTNLKYYDPASIILREREKIVWIVLKVA